MTNYNKIENLKFVESERLKWESSSIAKEKQLKVQYTISLANNEKNNNLIDKMERRIADLQSKLEDRERHFGEQRELSTSIEAERNNLKNELDVKTLEAIDLNGIWF
jgi:hypothetical protein